MPQNPLPPPKFSSFSRFGPASLPVTSGRWWPIHQMSRSLSWSPVSQNNMQVFYVLLPIFQSLSALKFFLPNDCPSHIGEQSQVITQVFLHLLKLGNDMRVDVAGERSGFCHICLVASFFAQKNQKKVTKGRGSVELHLCLHKHTIVRSTVLINTHKMSKNHLVISLNLNRFHVTGVVPRVLTLEQEAVLPSIQIFRHRCVQGLLLLCVGDLIPKEKL